MELNGYNQRINHNVVEKDQTEWDVYSGDTDVVSLSGFSKIENPVSSRLWQKMCKVLICTAIVESVSLGFTAVPHNITRYSYPFAYAQSTSDGRFMRMNDIQRWRLQKLGLSKQDDNFFNINEAMDMTSEAVSFLNINSELQPILVSTCSKLGDYFQDKKLYLEVIDDPEENISKLLLSIETNLSTDIAVDNLYRFDEDWWLDIAPAIRQKVCIDVVFV